MRKCGLLLAFAMSGVAMGQQSSAGPAALTIYNQDFAVARTFVGLDLNAGANEVTTTSVTSQLEPDSVVLRDPAGKIALKVMEQNYDAGVVTQDRLLQKYEGQTIQFLGYLWQSPEGKPQRSIVEGKIIRAGQQPLIEVEGVMQFQLPGTPLFPATTDGLLLKPTLRWQIFSPKAAHVNAELAYITHGMSWQATYNIVAPESSDVTGTEHGEVVGWVTIDNNSGTEFPEARIKLMAGDVAKLRNYGPGVLPAPRQSVMVSAEAMGGPVVTQKAFDDFHLYDLNRTVTLRNGETKQVEFMQAADVAMKRVYEYDGSNQQWIQMYPGYRNDQAVFGTESNKKVSVHVEIKNSEANHLGMPLPAGRIRMYRRDSSGQMEFVGENMIGHTPAEDTVKVAVGNAFDVTGARKQTDFHVDSRAHTIDESFEITLKNQKTVPATVVVVEHMNRGQNWELTDKPANYSKRDSNTVEIPVTVAARGETTTKYSVHYTW